MADSLKDHDIPFPLGTMNINNKAQSVKRLIMKQELEVLESMEDLEIVSEVEYHIKSLGRLRSLLEILWKNLIILKELKTLN